MDGITPFIPSGWTHYTRLLPPEPLPERTITYLVCSSPRSGSTFLCERLTSTGLAGDPQEYFHPPDERAAMEEMGISTFREYFSEAMWQATGENGVCGVKIHWVHLHRLVGRLRDLFGRPFDPIPAVLEAAFPGTRYIWISRRDTERQAVSLMKAYQSGVWHSWEGPQDLKEDAPGFDYDRLRQCERGVIQMDTSWKRFFQQQEITPYAVVYEDFVKDPEGNALDILRWLQIPMTEPVQFGSRSMEKLADAQSEEWVRRYQEIKNERGEEIVRR